MNPRFNIKDPERYIFERINGLRNLKTQNSVVRRSKEGSFFRITQRKLEDDSVMTTTERLLDEVEAKAEMLRSEAALAEAASRIETLRDRTETSITYPLRSLLNAAEALRKSPVDAASHARLTEIESAVSTCLLRVEKAMSEF